MDKRICGEFPEFCYKGFDCAEHANSFMNEGILHIGCLHYYRQIEDESRRDPTEGTARIKEPGVIIRLGVSPDPAEKTIVARTWGPREAQFECPFNKMFWFCTSLGDVNLANMSEQYGCIVRINNPIKLAEDLYDYYVVKKEKVLVWGCTAVYSKGQESDRELTNNERMDLSCMQKPESFSHECEFRIVVIKYDILCKPEECKFPTSGEFRARCDFMVKLGKQLDYTQLVSRE